jgi:NitT/TauT family transport system substrate-binding protein
MTDAYIAEICPGVEPQILYIANSPNRAAAMLAGEIDATPLKLVESMQLEREAPGKFHTLTNFSQDLPRLKTVLLYANRDFADQHPEVVQDYISAMLTVHRQINENPEMLIEEVSERLEVEPELLPEIIQAHLDINTWDVNGGVTEEGVLYSLEFYTSAGNLEPGLATTDVADLSYLEEVLDEMGRE